MKAMKTLSMSLFAIAFMAIVCPVFAAPGETEYLSLNDFESDPFDAANGAWVKVEDVDTQSTVEWSTAQAASGTHSIRVAKPTNTFSNWFPCAYTDLVNVPQTGIVKVQFKMYMTTAAHASTGVVFVHFGSITTGGGAPNRQILDIQIAAGTVGRLETHDGNGLAQRTGVNYETDYFNQWVTHTLLFNQDNLTYDYLIDPGSGEQLLWDDEPTLGTPVGDAAWSEFSSFGSAGPVEYFLDDFLIGHATYVPVELSEFVLE